MTALDEQIGGSHYKKYPIQPWKFCEINKLTGAQTAVIDYVMRHQDKNGLEDLLKARHHIDLMIEHYYTDSIKYCQNCTDINEGVFVKKESCECDKPKETFCIDKFDLVRNQFFCENCFLFHVKHETNTCNCECHKEAKDA